MIENKVLRYRYGSPFQTDAVILNLPVCEQPIQKLKLEEGIFTYTLEPNAAVYGLGESVRGMNKREGLEWLHRFEMDSHIDILTLYFLSSSFTSHAYF